MSGLRFALYTSNDVATSKLSERGGATDYYTAITSGTNNYNSTASSSGGAIGNAATAFSSPESTTFARDVLVHVYSNIWVECVVRSPLYVGHGGNALMECIKSTTFEKELDSYLSSLPWF